MLSSDHWSHQNKLSDHNALFWLPCRAECFGGPRGSTLRLDGQEHGIVSPFQAAKQRLSATHFSVNQEFIQSSHHHHRPPLTCGVVLLLCVEISGSSSVSIWSEEHIRRCFLLSSLVSSPSQITLPKQRSKHLIDYATLPRTWRSPSPNPASGAGQRNSEAVFDIVNHTADTNPTT